MEELRKQFPALKQQTYLNTASSGLLSQSLYTWRKEQELDFLNKGADFSIRKQIPEDARASVARFFNAKLEEVSLIPNFSFGFNTVLEGLPKGQKVLLLTSDYPSLLWPVETRNFECCYVGISANLETSIAEAFKIHRPDVFVFSVVQWLSGVKMDFNFLKELKKMYPETLFMADATQYMGTEIFDFNTSAIDVFGGSAYKWMLAGFGNGIMLVKKEAQKRIFPETIGFNSAATFDSFATETTFAKHFEPGHQDTFNYGSLHQAILQAERFSMKRIETQICKISAYAKECFIALDLLDETTKNRSIHSSIFNLKGNAKLFKKLSENNIIGSPRGGGIRVSFHYYNTKADVATLMHMMQS
jgi:selenocysteine lyase/cysteine desulfurase